MSKLLGYGKVIEMRQIDRIRKMSLEELAPLLVYSKETDVGDYDWDENPISFYQTFYYSPSGEHFDENSYEEAIADAINWLDSDYIAPDQCVCCTECENFHLEGCYPWCDFETECGLNDYKNSKPYKERPKYMKHTKVTDQL